MTPPPGYVAYGGANQGAYANFQRVGGLAKWLGVLMIVLVPVQIWIAFNSLSVRDKAEDYLARRITEDDFKDKITTSAGISLLSGAVLIAAAVLTMIWMFRIAKNLQAMNRVATWKPGWAIGGWFVPPLVLYVVPFLMFRDLWKASDPDSGHDWRTNRVAPIINVWWVLFGIAPVIFFSATIATFTVSQSTDTQAKDLVDRFNVGIASSVVQILAAISFLLLVRQLTARHQQVTSETT
jgi:uncharacterized membrane protein